MTNELSNAIQIGNDVVTVLSGLSPELLTVLACVVVGYGLRYLTWFRNKWIPPVLIFFVGPAVYYHSSFPDWDAFFDMQWPAIKQIILGMVFGLAAWTAHRAWLKDSWLERKLFPNGTTTTASSGGGGP